MVFVQTVMPCPRDFERFYMIVWVVWHGGIQNVLSFVLWELQSTVAGKESFLLSIRMNKAFHHLAAVLD